jgi:beta-N-acetylhexosaminidase
MRLLAMTIALALGGGLAASTAARAARRPQIVAKPIPFPAKRKREMAAYARRHYGIDSYRLRRPRVIVEHYTVNDSVRATFDTFAPDVPDVELHELPNVCSHFVVARNGQIFQLVALSLMCRHTVGLNYTAIGIEHVGRSDQDVLRNPRQLRASLRLTTWLRCRFAIGVDDVIGHSESLSSPYHRERVARLRGQTHADWTRASMEVYRRMLRQRATCSGSSIPAASRGSGRGSSALSASGSSPAQTSRSMSSSSSTGGPVRTLADASSSESASTWVALSSWRLGGRTRDQRPATRCSLNP